MFKFSGYNPIPPRAWSRVQNRCPNTDNNGSDLVFLTVPLTSQNPVTLAQAAYEAELLQKGNILQYKGNSSRLTKKQRYSQLAKGFGPNRTKVFATQSQTYTNPNTTGLARVNSVEIPFPNIIVGQPNNISGPFQYDVDNPFGCSSNSLQDGGNLVCGTYADPCSGEIIKTANTSATICNPASASDVPGSSILCWNETVQTWFPRQRYIMTNSGNKWPQGYKGFVSAITLSPPALTGISTTCEMITLSWNLPQKCDIFTVTGYNIYVNGSLYTTTLPTVSTYEFTEPTGKYTIYITTIYNSDSESEPSNSLEATIIPGAVIIGYNGLSIQRYNENGYRGLLIETTLSPTMTTAFGTGSFTICAEVTASLLVIGGGGGGSSGNSTSPGVGGGGGAGGGINYITGYNAPINTPISLAVGAGGAVRPGNLGGGNSAGYSGGQSFIGYSSTILTSSGGGAGLGVGSTSIGGGIGGNASKSNEPVGPVYGGYGGGGGGGGWSGNNTGNVTKPGPGGVGYTSNGFNGTNGGAIAGNGGGQSLTSIVLPFLPLGQQTIYLSGGGGGGGQSKGGLAGDGLGGSGQSASSNPGQNASNYGGGGGGGSSQQVNNNNNGGTGANGLIAIWWPSP